MSANTEARELTRVDDGSLPQLLIERQVCAFLMCGGAYSALSGSAQRGTVVPSSGSTDVDDGKADSLRAGEFSPGPVFL